MSKLAEKSDLQDLAELRTRVNAKLKDLGLKEISECFLGYLLDIGIPGLAALKELLDLMEKIAKITAIKLTLQKSMFDRKKLLKALEQNIKAQALEPVKVLFDKAQFGSGGCLEDVLLSKYLRTGFLDAIKRWLEENTFRNKLLDKYLQVFLKLQFGNNSLTEAIAGIKQAIIEAEDYLRNKQVRI